MAESHHQAVGSRPASAAPPPPAVVVIGHNSQVLPTVGLFVGADVPVEVFTSRRGLELELAPYPGVRVTVVEDDYATRPAQLPPPPYFVAVDDPEQAALVRAWLPPTRAVFLARGGQRHRGKAPGFLTLQPPQRVQRQEIFRRLEALARLDRLCAPARLAQRPLILLYGDPDPDAIGAALALAAIWRQVGQEPRIRYTGVVHRYQNRLLLKWLTRPITPLAEGELAESDLVAVVDAQPGFWPVDPPRPQVVIDHHPPTPGLATDFLDLRPGYGATSSILTEYLVEAEIRIDRQLATALLFGITTDTNDLKRNTASADIAAFEVLHDKADRRFLERLEKSQIPAGVLDYLAWGIDHRVVYRDLMLIHYGTVPYADVLVQTADLMLLTYGIAWVVAAGVVERDGRRLVAVFRSDGQAQDVGRRAREAFGELGSAGGHRTMARAELPLLPGQRAEDTVELLVAQLFRRMQPARSRRFVRTLLRHLEDERPADPGEFELVK